MRYSTFLTTLTWNGKRVKLPTGDIDSPKAKIVFTRGQCLNLALAINQLTEWPLCALYQGDNPMDIPHVGVASPKGFFDINGVGDTVAHEYGLKPEPLSMEDAKQLPVTNGYLQPRVKPAMPFAKNLVHRYFPEVL